MMLSGLLVKTRHHFVILDHLGHETCLSAKETTLQVVKMSLVYGLGGGASALTVVGLCEIAFPSVKDK